MTGRVRYNFTLKSHLQVPVIDIKQETVTEPDDDVESIDHFRLVKNEFDLETSEFEPDSVFEDDGKKSAHDDEVSK